MEEFYTMLGMTLGSSRTALQTGDRMSSFEPGIP